MEPRWCMAAEPRPLPATHACAQVVQRRGGPAAPGLTRLTLLFEPDFHPPPPHSRDHHLQPAVNGVHRRAQRRGRAAQRAAAGARAQGGPSRVDRRRRSAAPALRFLRRSFSSRAHSRISRHAHTCPPRATQIHWLRIILDEGHTLGSQAITNRLTMACEVGRGASGTRVEGAGPGGCELRSRCLAGAATARRRWRCPRAALTGVAPPPFVLRCRSPPSGGG